MGARTPLQPGFRLQLPGHGGACQQYVIGETVGFGGSCLVYEGYYQNHAGTRNAVRVKECYPSGLRIVRDAQGALTAEASDGEAFAEAKRRFRQSFDVGHELHSAKGLVNSTAYVFDRYEANQTVYIVSAYVEGGALADRRYDTPADVFRVVRRAAECIQEIHRQGYLYLDLKPENIFVYPETPEMVMLFDFDSVIPMDGAEDPEAYPVTCSQGFSPLEQRLGDRKRLGRYTDVYAVGALLFYLLFGRPPGAVDCGSDTVYDFASLPGTSLYRQELYRELTDFFHHTLQPCAADRYQDMGEAAQSLRQLEKYAAMPLPFLCPNHVEPVGWAVGRERECRELLRWYRGEERMIFVTGMGGIGKSTVVRTFLSEHRTLFDQVLYLPFQGSLMETLGDDALFCISGITRDPAECLREYYVRKLTAVRQLAADTDTVLVLDNFTGMPDADLTELLQAPWKIICITRCDMKNTGYACLEITALRERESLRQLFEKNMERSLTPEEVPQWEQLMAYGACHTLLLVLIARQIAKSYLSVQTAWEIIRSKGFSQVAPEKIDYMQDGKTCYDTLSGILRAVYDTTPLSEEKKKCLKLLSLFDPPGLPVSDAAKLLHLESLDAIHELKALGWLQIEGEEDGNQPETIFISMHPLVQETLHQMAWRDEYRVLAREEMRRLCARLSLEKKERKFFGGRERLLARARSVLRYCEKDTELPGDKDYRALLLALLLHMPKDQERYILQHAGMLFAADGRENPYAIMELYDYVVYLLCQKGEIHRTQKYLNRARKEAKSSRDPYLRGLYYEIEASYYEELLDGAYADRGREASLLRRRIMAALNRALRLVKKSDCEKANQLYIELLLGRAGLMIRSWPERKRQIERMLPVISEQLQASASGDAKLHFYFHMIQAWYQILCLGEENMALYHLEQAERLWEERDGSDLDYVDDFLIPTANMLLELGDEEAAFYWLGRGIEICEKHPDALPYLRKKRELLLHQIEICTHEE